MQSVTLPLSESCLKGAVNQGDDTSHVSNLHLTYNTGLRTARHLNSLCQSSMPANLLVVGLLRFLFLDINQPSLPTLFILFLCLFLTLWPFQLYFIP